MKLFYKLWDIIATVCVGVCVYVAIWAGLIGKLLMIVVAVFGVMFFLWIIFIISQINKMDKD